MSDPPDTTLARRQVRLCSPFEPQIHPCAGTPPEFSFEPFAFPYFPASQAAWLTSLCDLFFSQHQRMMATLLILNIPRKEWTIPLPPSQRCSTDSVSFRLNEEDLTVLPDHCRVAGSFQLAHASSFDEAMPLIPSFDGLHIIYAVDSRQTKHCFLRSEGQLVPTLPEALMIDDWRVFLYQHRDRLSRG